MTLPVVTTANRPAQSSPERTREARSPWISRNVALGSLAPYEFIRLCARSIHDTGFILAFWSLACPVLSRLSSFRDYREREQADRRIVARGSVDVDRALRYQTVPTVRPPGSPSIHGTDRDGPITAASPNVWGATPFSVLRPHHLRHRPRSDPPIQVRSCPHWYGLRDSPCCPTYDTEHTEDG